MLIPIPAKAGIQYYQVFPRFPSIEYGAGSVKPGMTNSELCKGLRLSVIRMSLLNEELVSTRKINTNLHHCFFYQFRFTGNLQSGHVRIIRPKHGKYSRIHIETGASWLWSFII